MLPAFVQSIGWGFLSGIFAGAFGVGGALLTTPALRLGIGTSAAIALGTTLPAMLPATCIAAVRYARAGLADLRTAMTALPFALAGSMAASAMTALIDKQVLMIATALVIMASALQFSLKGEHTGAGGRCSVTTIALSGLCAGIMSGLLGIGGGIVLVPAFSFLLGMEIRRAMGTSLIVITASAVAGSIVHYRLGHVDPMLAAGLAIGAFPGGALGSHLSVRASSRSVRRGFTLFLSIVGSAFLLSELRDLLSR